MDFKYPAAFRDSQTQLVPVAIGNLAATLVAQPVFDPDGELESFELVELIVDGHVSIFDMLAADIQIAVLGQGGYEMRPLNMWLEQQAAAYYHKGAGQCGFS